MKNYRLFLSIASIAIIILIVLLLPKTSEKVAFEPPKVGVRRVTPTPVNQPVSSLLVTSQVPGPNLRIDSVNFQEEGYIKVKKFNEVFGQSENLVGPHANLNIQLSQETKEGDTISVILYDKTDQEVERKEILTTSTALKPGAILPKDLQPLD